MTLTSVLADDKAPGALSTTAGLEGKVTGQTIYAGQQVVAASFGTSTEQAPQQPLKQYTPLIPTPPAGAPKQLR